MIAADTRKADPVRVRRNACGSAECDGTQQLEIEQRTAVEQGRTAGVLPYELRRFVTAHQQQAVLTFRVTHAIAGVEIKLKFRHSLGSVSMHTRIAMNQTIHAH
ncbi:MAG: hypothetical protein EAZ42_00765 [Verrucomicrobia bacterium]|nr:MAG: hypothetical protein EAZ42_00765 [Verrucomicrobiota bacterium]